MKKLRYESESLGMDTFIILSLFTLVIFLLTNLSDNNIKYFYFIIFYSIGCIFCGLKFINGLKNRIKYNKIVKNGFKVDGKILGIKTEITSSQSLNSPTEHDHSFEKKLYVQYKLPKSDKTYTILTEELNQDPQFYLGSRNCSVYILNDEKYITDFVKKEKGQANIWTNENLH